MPTPQQEPFCVCPVRRLPCSSDSGQASSAQAVQAPCPALPAVSWWRLGAQHRGSWLYCKPSCLGLQLTHPLDTLARCRPQFGAWRRQGRGGHQPSSGDLSQWWVASGQGEDCLREPKPTVGGRDVESAVSMLGLEKLQAEGELRCGPRRALIWSRTASRAARAAGAGSGGQGAQERWGGAGPGLWLWRRNTVFPSDPKCAVGESGSRLLAWRPLL